MNNLTERLRRCAAAQTAPLMSELLNEAAAEIAALRGKVADLSLTIADMAERLAAAEGGSL